MICEMVESWLLTLRSRENLPEELLRHTSACPRCQAVSERILTLDRTVHRYLARSIGPSSASARVMNIPLASEPSRRARRSFRIPLGTAALAACVLAVIGWIAGRTTGQREQRGQVLTKTVMTPATASAEPLPEPRLQQPTLSARLARISAKVTEESDDAIQIEHFAQMAEVIREESQRMAELGQVEQLPRLQLMHDRILKVGILQRLPRIPDHQRDRIQKSLSHEMDHSADLLDRQLRAYPSAIGDQLKPFSTQCRASARSIAEMQAPVEWKSTPPETPVERLVTYTLQVAETDAPLKRAHASSDLADALVQMITVVSSGGRPDDARDLGESLDSVMTYGVAVNLDRAAAVPESSPQVQLLRDKTTKVTETLQAQMAQVSPAAREGMVKALAASEPGREMAAGKKPVKPITTGPPWKRTPQDPNGKPHNLPPGLQKKQ